MISLNFKETPETWTEPVDSTGEYGQHMPVIVNTKYRLYHNTV